MNTRHQARSWKLATRVDNPEHIGLSFETDAAERLNLDLTFGEAAAVFMRLAKAKEEGDGSLTVEHNGRRYELEMPEGELSILWAQLGKLISANGSLIAEQHGPDRVRSLLGKIE